MADATSPSDDNIIISRKKARLKGSQQEEESIEDGGDEWDSDVQVCNEWASYVQDKRTHDRDDDVEEDPEKEEKSNNDGDDVEESAEEDDGEEYNDYEDEIPVCHECGGTPCQWTEFGSDLLEKCQEMYVTSMQSSQDGEVHTVIKDRSSDEVIPNNLVRKMLYRMFTTC